MARSLVLMLGGAIAGSAAVCLLAGPRLTTHEASQQAVIAASQGSAPAAGTQSSFTTKRVAVYEQVAAIRDRESLAASIRRVAAEPNSRLRDMELEALLARLAEIDPAAAVQLARNLYLEVRFLEPLFAAWAVVDIGAATNALAVIQPPARQRKLALAVSRVLGDAPDGLEQVMSALPASDRFSFEIAALADQARHDPLGALQTVLAMEQGTLQSMALQEVIQQAARLDPRGTLAQLAVFGDTGTRQGFTGLALGIWAETDPAAVFAWIDAADANELPDSIGVYQALADLDRDRVVAMLDDFPPAARTAALRAVVISAAATDPAAAAAMVDELASPGSDRDLLLQTIARSWGEQNPELALAWVKGLSPPSETALVNVLQGVAATDFDRAIDLMIEELDSSNQIGAPTFARIATLPLLLSITTTDSANLSRLLDRMLEKNDPRIQSMMSSAMSNWARNDPDAALDWALTHAGTLDANAFSQIGQQLAQSDIELAVNSLGRLQPEQRAGWLEGVLGQLAQTDINRAVSLLAQHRDTPGYENAYRAVVVSLARSDPPAAARMLQSAPSQAGLADARITSAASTIAREWARRDPAAAARWAVALSDSNTQRISLNAIGQSWVQVDADEAGRWVATLASGPARDAALDGFISAAAQTGDFDATLLDGYSSSEARQRGATRAILQIGQFDRAEAERLIDATFADDTTRRQMHDQLDRMGAAGAVISSGNVIINSGSILLR